MYLKKERNVLKYIFEPMKDNVNKNNVSDHKRLFVYNL